MLILLTWFTSVATAQDYIGRNLWQPFISVGYENADLGDPSAFYNKVIQYYQGEKIPIYSQSKFGPALHLSGGFIYSPLKPLWLGLGLSYYSSSASANYRGNDGSLSITGGLVSYQLDIIAREDLLHLAGLPLFVSMKPGVAFFFPRVTQNLVILDSANADFSNTTASPSWTIDFEATVGAAFPVGPLTLSLEGGYRFASSGQIPYSSTIPVPGELPYGPGLPSWNVHQSGPIFDLSIGFNIGSASPEQYTAAGSPSSVSAGSASPSQASGSASTNPQAALSHRTQTARLVVSVAPASASNAEITVVQKSITKISSDVVETSSINPDTLGTWKAPLSMVLGFGDYDVIAKKNGYGDEWKSVSIAENGRRRVPFRMIKLGRLSRIRMWSTLKWISAAVAAGSGIAAVVSNVEIGTSYHAYRNDASLSSIQEDRKRISSAQSWLGVTSSVAFTAAGACVASWIMEALNR